MIAVLIASVLAAQAPKILARAHSHNDYNRVRPLFEALDNGFTSIEIDVFFVEGKLLVAHDSSLLPTAKTIESLYFEPMVKLVTENSGGLYRGTNTKLWVLIDIKADGLNAYRTLTKLLATNKLMRSTILDTSQAVFHPPPCQFVVSGDRPIDAIVADKGKYAGLDGRWADLDKNYSSTVMPWVSEAWLSHFSWLGSGEFPKDQAAKLKSMVERVHQQKRLIRFWGAPDIPANWEVQWKAGVDLIGTDRPAELRKWMLAQKG